jgi:hypothetical protein
MIVTAVGLKSLQIDTELRARLAADYERFSTGLPRPLEDYVKDRYELDLSSEYGGLPLKNPFGKASGQLSLNPNQVRRDAEGGLGFVVLKTIIAEDSAGGQSMSEWAIYETRMLVERVIGANGAHGWTVTWNGRGWYDTFEKYLEFFGEALDIGRTVNMPIIPSCKYHLPQSGEGEWRFGEYQHTTQHLLDVWERKGSTAVMPIEKDFSPTLAGSDRAAQKQNILDWLTRVTGLIRRGADQRPIAVGLKMFNAVFEDDFQLQMMRAINENCAEGDAPDFLVYANRLFDFDRGFEGVRGVAYGGPDLSARNLSILERLRTLEQTGEIPPCRLPISATGDIGSGRTAVEYLLRGSSSFQMHTYFQLPGSEYRMRSRGKTERALHELLFNPEQGFIAWIIHLRRIFDWPTHWNVKQMADYCSDPVNRVWAVRESMLFN